MNFVWGLTERLFASANFSVVLKAFKNRMKILWGQKVHDKMILFYNWERCQVLPLEFLPTQKTSKNEYVNWPVCEVEFPLLQSQKRWTKSWPSLVRESQISSKWPSFLISVSQTGFSPSAGGAYGRQCAEEETTGALQQTGHRGLQPVRERPEPQCSGASHSLPVLLASSQPPHRSESLLLSQSLTQSFWKCYITLFI